MERHHGTLWKSNRQKLQHVARGTGPLPSQCRLSAECRKQKQDTNSGMEEHSRLVTTPLSETCPHSW